MGFIGRERCKADLFLLCMALLTLVFSSLCIHALVRQRLDAPMTAFNRGLVDRYALTDLCLFSEARYARHPSQSDLHTAFQDHPGCLEHFPAGGMAGLPATLRRR